MNKLIALDLLYPNPYQLRRTEDMIAVVELAESIEKNATAEFDGLLQVPTVREMGLEARFELAFGHTRLKAFQYLWKEKGLKRYAEMRVEIRDLTDLQMFELVVTENIKRRNLNPIEQAEALHRYMDEFNKTSTEAAEFFGIASSTIRGTVRLLNLPDSAQEKVRNGEITAGDARALLMVDKILGEEGVAEVLSRMDEENEGPIEAMNGVLRWQAKALKLDLDDGWVNEDPFPVKHLEALKKKDIEECIWGETAPDGEGGIEVLMSYVQSGMTVSEEAFPRFEPEDLERVQVLMNPPACERCPLHARLDGDHYCAFKACAKRKSSAWLLQDSENISKKIGIPVYEQADGIHVDLSQYDPHDKELVADQHCDLRLMTQRNVWNNFKGIGKNTKVVAVGELARKRIKKAERKAEKTEQPVDEKSDWQFKPILWRLKREYMRRFAWEVGSKVFADALNGVTNLSLMLDLNEELNADYLKDVDEREVLAGIEKARKNEGLKQARRLVMMGMLDRHAEWADENKAVVKHAKKIVKLAEKWGVKLPKDWIAQAEKYQLEYETAHKELVKQRAEEK